MQKHFVCRVLGSLNTLTFSSPNSQVIDEEEENKFAEYVEALSSRHREQ